MPRFVLAAAVLTLAGCATVPDDFSVGDDWPVTWSLNGRLALSNGRDGGSGELRWRQGHGRAQLQFVGALGRGSWELRQEPGRAELLTASGERYVERDVAALLDRHFGWRLPVSALVHWVRGRPEPGAPVHGLEAQGDCAVAFRQHGWTVAIEPGAVPADSCRPRRLTATRGADRVRLVIRQWRDGEAA